MTLDEAIKHAEEVAEEQKELYRLCPASESEIFHCDGTKDCKTLENGKNKGCQKCSEEHRQLAEWLKDYKRLLEQDKEQDPCDNCKYLDGDGCRLVFEQIEYGKASDECPSEDCISQQAVLNIVDSYSESQSNVEDVIQDIISDIVALPSVNPQKSTEEATKEFKELLEGGYYESQESVDKFVEKVVAEKERRERMNERYL